jgi:hypothetical protein
MVTTFCILAASLAVWAVDHWLGLRDFERNRMRIPLEISHDGKQVRRFLFTAHDGTRIVIWHENEMLADYCFEKSKWRGKPKKMKELRPDEVCEGR